MKTANKANATDFISSGIPAFVKSAEVFTDFSLKSTKTGETYHRAVVILWVGVNGKISRVKMHFDVPFKTASRNLYNVATTAVLAEKPIDGMDIDTFLGNVNMHIKDVIRCMPEKLAA